MMSHCSIGTTILRGIRKKIGIPRMYQASEAGEYKQEEIYFTLDKELTVGLENLAKENKVTLNTLIQTIVGNNAYKNIIIPKMLYLVRLCLEDLLKFRMWKVQ